jgi:hypothetical protein
LSSAALYWLIGTNPPTMDARRSEELSCHIRSEIIAVLQYWLRNGDGLRDILDTAGLLERLVAFVDEIKGGGLDTRTDQEVIVVNEVAAWWQDVCRGLLNKVSLSTLGMSEAADEDLSLTTAAFQRLQQSPFTTSGDELFDGLDIIGNTLARALTQSVSWICLESKLFYSPLLVSRVLRICIPLALCSNDSLAIHLAGITARTAHTGSDKTVT